MVLGRSVCDPSFINRALLEFRESRGLWVCSVSLVMIISAFPELRFGLKTSKEVLQPSAKRYSILITGSPAGAGHRFAVYFSQSTPQDPQHNSFPDLSAMAVTEHIQEQLRTWGTHNPALTAADIEYSDLTGQFPLGEQFPLSPGGPSGQPFCVTLGFPTPIAAQAAQELLLADLGFHSYVLNRAGTPASADPLDALPFLQVITLGSPPAAFVVLLFETELGAILAIEALADHGALLFQELLPAALDQLQACLRSDALVINPRGVAPIALQEG
jgi:hypothetical protein